MSVKDSQQEAAASAKANLRGQRIVDYLDKSLAEDDPLLANLGVVNSDLMHYQYLLRKHVDDALSQATPSSDDVEFVLLPAIGQSLKVTKQIERNAQFGHRVKQQDEKCTLSRVATATAALNGNDDS